MADTHTKTAPATAPYLDEETKARIAATLSRVHLAPVDINAPNLLRQFANIFRQRAKAGWVTPLSPETGFLVAAALDAYAPAPPPIPQPPRDRRLYVNMFSQGSTVYRMRKGEEVEIEAWARSSLVAGVAFEELVRRNPDEEYMQRRRAWVERNMQERS